MRCERGEGSRWELWPLGIGLADTVETHQLDVKVSLWHPPLLHHYCSTNPPLVPFPLGPGSRCKAKAQVSVPPDPTAAFIKL